jgi:hypothetical protein
MWCGPEKLPTHMFPFESTPIPYLYCPGELPISVICSVSESMRIPTSLS